MLIQNFTLITGKDTKTGIDVSKVGVDLAKAGINLSKTAQKDSKSMKVIAYLSMAFLPATSIASLLAVPWDRGNKASNVIQGSVFGVATVLVYAVMYSIWYFRGRYREKVN